MKMMTLQEAFTKAVTGVLNQRRMSKLYPDVEGSSTCAYTSPSGDHCAVGFLIDPKVYSEWLEGKQVDDEVVKEALEASGVPTDKASISLYSAMQEVHDFRSVSEWDWKFAELGERAGLKMPNRYRVACRYRNPGDQGVLHLSKTVTVFAMDEDEARLNAIDVMYKAYGICEHVTPIGDVTKVGLDFPHQ